MLERLYVLFDERHQFVEIGERMLDAGADVLHSASPTLWLHTFIFVDYDPK